MGLGAEKHDFRGRASECCAVRWYVQSGARVGVTHVRLAYVIGAAYALAAAFKVRVKRRGKDLGRVDILGGKETDEGVPEAREGCICGGKGTQGLRSGQPRGGSSRPRSLRGRQREERRSWGRRRRILEGELSGVVR